MPSSPMGCTPSAAAANSARELSAAAATPAARKTCHVQSFDTLIMMLAFYRFTSICLLLATGRLTT